MRLHKHCQMAGLWKIGQILDFLGGGLYSRFRNVKGMKSQLMTALSIVGVLGTATTAMAVNTDALANLDPSAIGTATDTLLPDSTPPADPAAPAATPAPTETAPVADPSAQPGPGATSGGTTPGGTAVQNPQAAPVNGTTGGSGSRVNPATGAVEHDDDDDHDDDEGHEEHEDHEEEDDD